MTNYEKLKEMDYNQTVNFIAKTLRNSEKIDRLFCEKYCKYRNKEFGCDDCHDLDYKLSAEWILNQEYKK